MHTFLRSGLVISLLLLGANTQSLLSQQYFDFVTSGTQSANSDADHHVDADAAGNIYVAGTATDYMAIQGDTANCPHPGSRDIYLAKFDSDGNLLWQQTMGAAWYDSKPKMVVSPAGDIYMGFHVQNSPVAFKDSTVFKLDRLLCKFSTDGDLEWVKEYGPTGSNRGMEADNSGIYFERKNDAADQNWITKLSPSGAVIWDVPIPGSYFYADDITLNPAGDKLVVAAYYATFFGAPTIDGSVLPGTGPNYHMVIFELENIMTAATVDWVSAFTNNGDMECRGAKYAADGGVIICGNAKDMTFGAHTVFTSLPGNNLFIAKLDASGNPLWLNEVQQTSSTGFFEFFDLVIKSDGSIIIGGQLQGEAFINGTSITQSSWASGAMVLKLDAAGNFVSNHNPSDVVGTNLIESIVIAPSGDIWMSGHNFSSGAVWNCLAVAQKQGFMLTRMIDGDGPVVVAEIDHTGGLSTCDGVAYSLDATAPDLDVTYQWFKDWFEITGAVDPVYEATSAGEYWVQVSYEACTEESEKLILSLLPSPEPPNIIRNVDLLEADAGYDQYQWYRDGLELTGETNQTLAIPGNGDYYVEGFNVEGCSAPSNLLTVEDFTGLQDVFAAAFQISPNPTSHFIVINAAIEMQYGVAIYSASGQLLFDGNNSPSKIDLADWPSGMYMIAIYSKDQISTRRFLKD